MEVHGDGLMAAAGDTLIGPKETQIMLVEFKTKQHLIGVVLVNGMIMVKQKKILSSADLELLENNKSNMTKPSCFIWLSQILEKL